MYQNELTEKEQVRECVEKFTVAPIEALYQQAKIAEKFLEVIKDTLERCEGCDWGKYEKGIEFILFFNLYDHESLEIGYVGKDIYLLNSDFIYRRFRYSIRKTYFDIPTDKSTIYTKLFQMGILTPYRKSKTKPIHTIWYNKGLDSARQTECICIPMEFVDFDADKIFIH